MCPYYFNPPCYNCNGCPMSASDFSRQPPFPYFNPTDEMNTEYRLLSLKDYGPKPYVVNINEATKQTKTFRTALWTGKHLQVTLMSIKVGEDVGLEIHPITDQFLRVEAGQGVVRMGRTKDKLDFKATLSDEMAIMVPAGTWHNIINTGNKPLKLYSIYAPPHHPYGTVHKTKEDAEAAEKASP